MKLRVLALSCLVVGVLGVGLAVAGPASALVPNGAWNVETDPNDPSADSGCIAGATWEQVGEMEYRMSRSADYGGPSSPDGKTCWWHMGPAESIRFQDEVASLTGQNVRTPSFPVVHPPPVNYEDHC
jgi:hypothetical protein